MYDCDSNQKTIFELAHNAAARFRRVWWADQEELRQEALVGILTTRADAPNQYRYVAGMRTAAAFVRNTRTPVKLSWRQRSNLGGFSRVALDENQLTADSSEEELVDADWRVRVRLRVQHLAESIRLGPVAVSALFEEERTTAEVAAEFGVGVKTLYQAVARLKKVLAGDVEIRRLWKEGP